MDPLSVIAGIAGILQASMHISKLLSSIVSNVKSAPEDLISAKAEVDSLYTIVLEIQALLIGSTKSTRSGEKLVLVQQVVIVLASCVATLGEVDVLLGRGDSDQVKVWDRVKWAATAGGVWKCLEKLRTQKQSLTLMISILTCKSTNDAEDAACSLASAIQQVLASQCFIAERLSLIEEHLLTPPRNATEIISHLPETPTRRPGNGISEAQFFHASKDSPSGSDASVLSTPQRSSYSNSRASTDSSSWREDLSESWAYRRLTRKEDNRRFSVLTSSTTDSASWSLISGIALSDISNIGVVMLPIYAVDINNTCHYRFTAPIPLFDPAVRNSCKLTRCLAVIAAGFRAAVKDSRSSRTLKEEFVSETGSESTDDTGDYKRTDSGFSSGSGST